MSYLIENISSILELPFYLFPSTKNEKQTEGGWGQNRQLSFENLNLSLSIDWDAIRQCILVDRKIQKFFEITIPFFKSVPTRTMRRLLEATWTTLSGLWKSLTQTMENAFRSISKKRKFELNLSSLKYQLMPSTNHFKHFQTYPFKSCTFHRIIINSLI